MASRFSQGFLQKTFTMKGGIDAEYKPGTSLKTRLFKKSTKIDFLLAALNLNLITENKSARKNARFMDDALKTEGIKCLNIGTWLLFSRLYQNFWLRDWFTIPSHMARKQTFLTPLV